MLNCAIGAIKHQQARGVSRLHRLLGDQFGRQVVVKLVDAHVEILTSDKREKSTREFASPAKILAR